MNASTVDQFGHNAILLLVAGSSLVLGGALLTSLAARVRVRIRRPRLALPTWGGLWSLGFTLAISTPAAAGPRRPSPLPRRDPVAAQPWQGVSHPSPDREAPAKAQPWEDTIHPAIHPDRRGRPHDRLFPRVTGCADEKRACMQRHPAGKGISEGSQPSVRAKEPHPVPSAAASQSGSGEQSATHRRPLTRHVVKQGDSLWGIAATALGETDVASIARYWPRIHRANRDVIGADPDLLLPGQVLELPEFDR
jgi:hypothetical protein